MRVSFQEAKRLISLVGLFAGAVGVFAVLRAAAVPEGLVNFAGQAECASCHDSQLQVRNGGRHKGISCETCHGPQAKHAAGGESKPAKPNVLALCLNCHEKDAAKPAARPQIDKAEHYNGTTCSDCHLPHNPKM